MKKRDNRAEISELAASEDGVFTSGQAARFGIPRYALSQSAKAGYIERVGHGAYRLTSAMDDGLDSLRAVYKLTSPEAFTYERRGAGFDGVAACGATAAYVLDVGDLRPTPWEIATPTRFNSRREEVHFRTERLAMDDVMWVRGIPVTRPERTISDLVAADLDLSLVSDVFLDSLRSYGSGPFDISKLVSLLGAKSYQRLCAASGLEHGGPLELVRLDELGHVALRRVGASASV